MPPNGWRASEVPFGGILASAVHPSVSRSDASLSIPRLLEIRLCLVKGFKNINACLLF